MRVAVLGAGVMGRNIARVFARAGADVALTSRSEPTLADARRALADEAVIVTDTSAAGSGAASVIETGTSIAAAVARADLVIESVPERLELKHALLAEAEAAAPPGAVLATNTSSLPLDELAAPLQRPERFLGLHWFNPAHLIPLVEVVPGSRTDPEVVEWSTAALERAGKRPLVLRRAVPGYVVNRLQYALIREALQLVEDGVADPAAIDASLTDCLGLRWTAIGPMRSTDLAGVETAMAVAEQLFPDLCSATAPQGPLRELHESGRTGVRAGEGFYRYPDADAVLADRDRRLAAVLTALAHG